MDVEKLVVLDVRVVGGWDLFCRAMDLGGYRAVGILERSGRRNSSWECWCAERRCW